MFRTALITLALSLALVACAQQSTPNPGAAPNANTTRLSIVITCKLPGAESRRILVPEGRSPTDFCPASAISDRFQHATPGVIYALPAPGNAAPLAPTKDAGQHP